MKRLAVMVLLVACAKGTNPPVINDFHATPASVHLGNKTMLSWDVSGASQISIDQGVGVQQGHSVDVTPGAVGDTTYTLTATGLGGTVTKATTVTVLGAVAKPAIESFTGAPIPIRRLTRASSHPTRNPTQHPKLKPATTSGTSEKWPARKSTAARTSSRSPWPRSCFPSLSPVPRKLNRNTAPPHASNAFAAGYTTLLCSVPPNRGCGWQTTAANRGRAPCAGVHKTASSFPAGPARKKFLDS